MLFALLFAAIALGSAAAADPPLIQTAMDVFSRSTSEVLSLNLSGLIILLVLKVVVVLFSLMGGEVAVGARSAQPQEENKAALTGGMCFLLYTSGEEERLGCVARAACESADTATAYLSAAKLWYKMHKLVAAVPYSERYNSVIREVEAASTLGRAGGDCASLADW